MGFAQVTRYHLTQLHSKLYDRNLIYTILFQF